MSLRLSEVRVRLFATVLAVAVSSPRAHGDAKAVRLIDIAQPATRPAGAPKYSDVCFSSRWIHPKGKDDPHDSLKAAEAFHATRFDWAYITDKEFIKEIKHRGLTFCPATNTSAFVGDLRPKQKRGRIVDLGGNIVTAPWMRMWKHSSWGCVNSPDYRESYLARLKQYADLGADAIQTDDPGNNWTATKWGACFCKYCMTRFNCYLKINMKAKELVALGIEDVDRFSYADYLRRQNAPVGDAFSKWDGGKLKEHFVEFQRRSVEEFYRTMWSALNEHAGRHVPISCNNYAGRWTFPYHLFDFGVAELPHREATAGRIRAILMEARVRSKAQVFTFVSTDVHETRRVIATCYANGGHVIVPWDVYLKSTPEGSDRYFGKPEEYADLYAFVRRFARYFDDYEDAAAFGAGISADRHAALPLIVEEADDVLAFARVRPARADAPIVVHLINTGDASRSFVLTWRKAAFFQERSIRAEWLRPGAQSEELSMESNDGNQTVRIGDLGLWGIVVLHPR
jgi:hypothetical protein